MAMLKIEKIGYKVGKKTILRNVCAEVRDGDFIVLTGPNGSGKSTLAKILMGIIQPSRGKIIYNGTGITDRDITWRSQHGISYAFQTPTKIKGITVRDLLITAGGEDAIKYIKTVGLSPDEYLDRELSDELSGGEMKRIEIASVLARESDLMIFDEPEAGIDIWSFDNLIKIFQKLRKQGKTVIVISHQDKILKCASRIMLLRDGGLSEIKSYDELKELDYGRD